MMEHHYYDPINRETRKITTDEMFTCLTGPQHHRMFDDSILGKFLNRSYHASKCPCRRKKKDAAKLA